MILLIADHRLYWLRDVIDRILILENGRVCSSGTFSILEDPAFQLEHGLRKTRVESSLLSLCPLDSDSGDGIRIQNLSFAYKNKSLLFENLNAVLPKGGVISLMGANGTGKTIFARLLTRLLKFKSGKISLNRKPVKPRDLLQKGCIIQQNTDHQLHMKSVMQELVLSGRHLKKQVKQDKI